MSNSSTASTNVTIPSQNGSMVVAVQVAEHIAEQETQIRTLTKQLDHCENDLQANIDLVNTLELALNESERNLRRARSQMNDLTKERDAQLAATDLLREQLVEAEENAATAKSSVTVERERFASKLEDEKRMKSKARADLESKMEESE